MEIIQLLQQDTQTRDVGADAIPASQLAQTKPNQSTPPAAPKWPPAYILAIASNFINNPGHVTPDAGAVAAASKQIAPDAASDEKSAAAASEKTTPEAARVQKASEAASKKTEPNAQTVSTTKSLISIIV